MARTGHPGIAVMLGEEPHGSEDDPDAEDISSEDKGKSKTEAVKGMMAALRSNKVDLFEKFLGSFIDLHEGEEDPAEEELESADEEASEDDLKL